MNQKSLSLFPMIVLKTFYDSFQTRSINPELVKVNQLKIQR